jgi:site-specific DNA-methyltransferase (adenine-specific)
MELVYRDSLVELYLGDCRPWLGDREDNSIHAVITDPPYGMLEYSPKEVAKLRAGRGGVWRIPPSIGGSKRAPLPRFTVSSESELTYLYQFFREWGELVLRVLAPGGHVFVATSPLFNHLVAQALVDAGLEKRGEVVRLVRTLRGGDRPKGAETDYAGVSAMPRSSWEPWLLLRKRLEGTLAENLRRWGTGALRRPTPEAPFTHVIASARTPREEKRIAPHPSLKPQAFLRQITHAALPLGRGVVLDPFAGSGSTLAACSALGYQAIGIEADKRYAAMAAKAIPTLAAFTPAVHSAVVVHMWDQIHGAREQLRHPGTEDRGGDRATRALSASTEAPVVLV